MLLCICTVLFLIMYLRNILYIQYNLSHSWYILKLYTISLNIFQFCNLSNWLQKNVCVWQYNKTFDAFDSGEKCILELCSVETADIASYSHFPIAVLARTLNNGKWQTIYTRMMAFKISQADIEWNVPPLLYELIASH